MSPWRDPRLLLGVLLVLGATLLGARLVAAGDDTVAYWTVRDTVVAGDAVSRGDLVSTRVHLSSGARDNYVRVDDELPAPMADLVWVEGVERGSLVEERALANKATLSRSQLPLNVLAGAYPGDLERGDLVDVWVGPGPGDEDTGDAVRVLQGVRVAQSDKDDSGALSRTVVVDVNVQLSSDVLSTVAVGHVTLVRVS